MSTKKEMLEMLTVRTQRCNARGCVKVNLILKRN